MPMDKAMIFFILLFQLPSWVNVWRCRKIGQYLIAELLPITCHAHPSLRSDNRHASKILTLPQSPVWHCSDSWRVWLRSDFWRDTRRVFFEWKMIYNAVVVGGAVLVLMRRFTGNQR